MTKISFHQRMDAFLQLGMVLRKIAHHQPISSLKNAVLLQQLVQKAVNANAWFTPENVEFSIQAIGESLTETNLQRWLQPYLFNDTLPPKTIGVVMAGNIPLVGFHDFLCVLLSGNRLVIKTAAGDAGLTATLSQLLIEIEPDFSPFITFSEGIMKNCDAYIATGSNNSARYFEQYFGQYPHIIRQHRNAVAVLHGNETETQISALGEDVFRYYGLGCRNVSKIFVPQDFNVTTILQQWESWKSMNENFKYFHNYIYQKTICLVNNDLHLDSGFLLLKKNIGFSSPIAVLYYEEYPTIDAVVHLLQEHQNHLQCIVSECPSIPNAVPFGEAQHPQLWNYADGIDTMQFLFGL